MNTLFRRASGILEHGYFAGDPVTVKDKIMMMLNGIHKTNEFLQYYLD